MNDSRFILEKYLRYRLAHFGEMQFDKTPGQTLLNKVAATILPSGNSNLWQRRPSISEDGEPVVLSLKLGKKRDQAVRILVECGSLKMTVAQQVAYSLTKLDDLLGELGWRDVAEVINSITINIFPANFSEIISWRGGMWLGAEVTPDSSKVELRIYFNLRHGIATERWHRLATIISSFSSYTIDPFLTEWINKSGSLAIPVGLGVVISGNTVSGIRAYLGVEHPTLETILKLSGNTSKDTENILAKVFDTFVPRFGPVSRQGATMGYDFLPGGKDVTRVKVDLCCHLINPDFSYQLMIWMKELLRELSFNEEFLAEFLLDVNAFWGGSVIQFLSLGFTPELQHATIYVKTGP